MLQASGLARVTLGDLFDTNGKRDQKPADLGIIGSERFAYRFAAPAVFEVAFGYRPRYQGGRDAGARQCPLVMVEDLRRVSAASRRTRRRHSPDRA